MHKLVAFLSMSTIALAVTSIYLWIELREARIQVSSLDPPVARAAPPEPGSNATALPRTREPAKAADSPIEDEKARQERAEEQYRESARRALAQLSDPTMRAQMLEEWKEANLANKSKYARHLGIDETDVERLIDLLAEHNLARTEAITRCQLQPRCDIQAVFRETRAAEQQAIADLFGADTQQRYEHYMYSIVERQMVTQFLRDRIPMKSQLSDEQTERLVAALADERRLVETEIRQRGMEPFAFPMEGVAFTLQNNPYEGGNIDDRLNEATAFNRRLHARASSMLTPRQLAAFEQMQDAAIAGLKSSLRRAERDLATRNQRLDTPTE
jgi:hypothetical protein